MALTDADMAQINYLAEMFKLHDEHMMEESRIAVGVELAREMAVYSIVFGFEATDRFVNAMKIATTKREQETHEIHEAFKATVELKARLHNV